MISITINDAKVQTPENSTVSDTLRQHQPSDGSFAVALNGEFVPRSQYDSTHLNEGDAIDVVSPVGGG